RALVWAINALNQLATFRNDVVHADMMWAYDKLETGFLSKDKTRERLENSPFDSHWRQLKGDFSAISNYLMDLSLDISFQNTWPSTKRPKLKLVSSKSTKKQVRKPDAKQKARSAQ